MRTKFVLAGLSILAALGIACGSSTDGTDSSVGGGPQTGAVNSDDAPGGPVTAAIGQTITLTNTLLNTTDKVEITLTDPRQASNDPGSSGFNKPSNGVYLVVMATIVCTEGTYIASPFDFTFVAADGTVHDPTFTLGFEPHLDSITLNAGQRTAGNVVFDVPKAAITGAKIQVGGIGLDALEAAAYWAL
jgi:hypothetical protein